MSTNKIKEQKEHILKNAEKHIWKDLKSFQCISIRKKIVVEADQIKSLFITIRKYVDTHKADDVSPAHTIYI